MNGKDVLFNDVGEKCANSIRILVDLSDIHHGGSCGTLEHPYRGDAITLRLGRK